MENKIRKYIKHFKRNVKNMILWPYSEESEQYGLKVVIKNQGFPWPNDLFKALFYELMKISWITFFVVWMGVYCLLSLFFSAAYYIQLDGLEPVPRDFFQVFFHSFATLIGLADPMVFRYDAPYIAIASVANAFVGVVLGAVFLGLVLSRFAVPSHFVLFSSHMVFYHDVEQNAHVLKFRCCNVRDAPILNAEVSVCAILSAPGGMRVIKKLELVRDFSPSFTKVPWTVTHVVTEESPLHGHCSGASACDSSFRVVVSLQGKDTVLFDEITAYKSYSAHEILFDAKFDSKSIVFAQNELEVYFDKFHNVILPENSELKPLIN